MPRKAKSKTKDIAMPEDWNYEEAVEAVEAIVSGLENGDLALEEVFEQFEQAVTQLKQCERFLQDKQEQVALLIETLDSENA